MSEGRDPPGGAPWENADQPEPLRVVAEPVSDNPRDGQEPLADETAYVRRERELALKNLEQDISARKELGEELSNLVKKWLIAILGILTLSGFKFLSFELSDAVLIALLTTTTATILGLFAVVVAYRFPNRKP